MSYPEDPRDKFLLQDITLIIICLMLAWVIVRAMA